MPKLSILICTLENRKNFFERLTNELRKQCNEGDFWNKVEILSEIDNGELSIGSKRNILLNKAEGEYITFIDDDDMVAPNYICLVLDAINKSNPDVIGIHLLMTQNGTHEERTYHSLKYRTWYQEADPDRPGKQRYFRNPNHLNPVKRELALQIRFPQINIGEDKDYSARLLPLLNTEEYISEPIYFYLYRSK